MGVVFRALDEQLRRDVAVKILPNTLFSDAASRERLRKEALAVGRLNHPNIAMAFDFGEESGVAYFVSEYISGPTLDEKIGKQPLPQKMLLELGIQLLSGLEAAHRGDVIHHDLKPANIRLNRDGQLKILDFGLARLIEPIDENAQTSSLDSKTSISGTLPYMAPELLRAEPADTRADIWAAGAVLYEMATGKRAFPDKQPSLVIDAILHYDPVRPTLINPKITAPLEAVILKALDRDPDRRYQTARELRVDLARLLTDGTSDSDAKRASSRDGANLHGLGPARAYSKRRLTFIVALVLLLIGITGILVWRYLEPANHAVAVRSIAVLPFTDLSASVGQEYFAEGLTEELISQLTQVGALRVISRSSVMQYKGKPISPTDIGRQLNVEGVIEGTVRRQENRVRITVELSDARGGRNLWSHSYERDLVDVLRLQTEVARAIVDEVKVEITPQEQQQLAVHPPTIAPQVYEDYLQARYNLSQRTPADLRIAVAKFEAVTAADPNYARAFVGLADAYTLLGLYRAMPTQQALQSARAAAKRAIELDPRLGDAHASLGFIGFLDLEWDRAEEEFKAALDLNPGYATAHHWCALYLAAQGQSTEALKQINVAEALDPNSSIIQANIAWCYYLARQYDMAIAKAKEALAHDPGFVVAHEYLGQSYVEKGQFDNAIAELSTAVQLSGGVPYYTAELANAYASAGRTAEARSLLRELESEGTRANVSAADLAMVYAGLHDIPKATELLETAVRERNPMVVELKVHPRYDVLRSDPRFAALVERLGREPEASTGTSELGTRNFPELASSGLDPTPAR
jgi:serine/threonine protein kinase/Tfp pilus assembly protein PilF